jgi:hypothetical protein
MAPVPDRPTHNLDISDNRYDNGNLDANNNQDSGNNNGYVMQ